MRHSRSNYPQHCLLFLLAALVLAGRLHADVLSVPADFGSIQAAVDAALPGDIVVVQAGSWGEDVVLAGKGVSLMARSGVVTLDSLEVSGVPGGQQLLLRGLDVPHASGSPGVGLLVQGCTGAVRVEDCSFRGRHGSAGSVIPFSGSFDGSPGASVLGSIDVAFARCLLRGGAGASIFDEDVELGVADGGHGLLVQSSKVAVLRCELQGLSGGSIFDTLSSTAGHGGHGILAQLASRLHVAGSALTGGDGGDADCDTFTGFCGSGGRGGDGIRLANSSHASTRDNVSLPGEGGVHGDFSGTAPDGVDVFLQTGSTHAAQPAAFRHLRVPVSPVVEGELFEIHVGADAGDVSVVYASLTAQYFDLPEYQGVLLFAFPAFAAVVGAVGGDDMLTIAAPALPAGIQGVDVLLQSVVGSDREGLLLGPLTTVTVLDAGL